MLHINDNLVGQQVTVCVDWSIVVITFVGRIIPPCRTPVTGIPIVITAGDQDDNNVLLLPPNPIMTLMAIPAECLGITNTLVLVFFPADDVLCRRTTWNSCWFRRNVNADKFLISLRRQRPAGRGVLAACSRCERGRRRETEQN